MRRFAADHQICDLVNAFDTHDACSETRLFKDPIECMLSGRQSTGVGLGVERRDHEREAGHHHLGKKVLILVVHTQL